jgi:hypothetical protein
MAKLERTNSVKTRKQEMVKRNKDQTRKQKRNIRNKRAKK